MKSATFSFLSGSLAFCSILHADEVLRFRGAGGSGVTLEQSFPTEWSSSNNVAWKTKVEGHGWSSPVVAAGKVFLTSATHPEQERPMGYSDGVRSMGIFREASKNLPEMSFDVHCLDLHSGEKLWTKSIIKRVPGFGIHPSNTFATETPATDGERVYAYFAAAGVVAAVDTEGSLVWLEEVGVFPHGNGFGSGSGLAISDGRVFVQCDNDENSFVQAFSAKDGKTLWRKERSGRTSWSTPLVWKSTQSTALVVCGSGHVTGYDPESGEQLWKLKNFGGSFSSSPAVNGDHIFMGNSGPRSSGPLVALESSATGELELMRGKSDGWVKWSKSGSGPGLASPVANDGLLYVIKSPFLNCYDSETGETVYEERLPSSARAAASLWIAGDNLFILNEDGNTFVVPTGRTFSVANQNKIDDLFWSTPSVAGSSLILRGADFVYCIRGSNQRVASN